MVNYPLLTTAQCDILIFLKFTNSIQGFSIMSNVQIHLVSWNSFLTRNFIITSELLGLAHKFPFEIGEVTVQLPAAINYQKA